MLSVKVSGTAALVKKLQRLPSSAASMLLVALNQQMMQLQSYIVANFLSGQVLTRRSGRLARSVQPIPAKLAGTKAIVAGVTAGGDVAFYGKFFEETATGGTGGIGHMWAVNAVKARALQFLDEGGKVIYRQYSFPGSKKGGLAARPFLIPAMEQKLPDIMTALNEAIDEALNES